MQSISEKEKELLNRSDRPPLCIDCDFISTSSMGQTDKHRCLHPNNLKGISLVDGSRVYTEEFCIMCRNSPALDVCGVQGKWFEVRQPLPPMVTKIEVSNITPAERFKQLRSGKITESKLDNL